MKKLMMILSLMFTFNVNALADFVDPRAALVAIYDSTNGDNWTNNTNWKTQWNYCFWYGVTCDGNNDVIRLQLGENNLTGTIPSKIRDLWSLEKLDLYNNNLTGSIPSEIGDLTKLKYLHLFNNNLTGYIPSEIGKLTKLTTLTLYNNNLTGTIPSEIGDLTELTILYLGNNNLTGYIPSEIGKLTELKYLTLSYNNLTGYIPSSITNLTKIEDGKLYLYENCSLKTNEQSVVDFINDNTHNGYQYILDTNGNCMNLSPVYYLLLN